MSLIIPVLIYGFIIYGAIKNANKAKPIKRDSQVTYTKPDNPNSYKDFAKQSKGGRDSNIFEGLEDRRNDWLAQQLAEERKAQKLVSDMFIMQMQHEMMCESDRVRREHERHCDADGIDIGCS